MPILQRSSAVVVLEGFVEMKKVSKGQAHLEYTLIGGLGVLTIFFAWLAFSGDLHELLKGALVQMQAKEHSAAALSKANPGGRQSLPEMMRMEIKLSDGSLVNLTQAPVNLPKLVETVGANGTTDKLAFALEDLTRALAKSGKLNEEQANTLLELANQGHHMAAVQKYIETSVETGITDELIPEDAALGSDYERSRTNEAAMGFLTRGNEDVSDEFSDPPGWELRKLQALYLTARENGALDEPAVKEIVTKMTSDIGGIAQSVFTNFETLVNENTRALFEMRTPPKYTRAQFNAMVGADESVTNSKSATICTAGNGADSGVLCTGKE